MPNLVARFAWGFLAGLGLAVGSEGYSVLIGRNFRPVIDGRIYRSAQLREDDLVEHCRAHGIRTVVNLRGCWPTFDWYDGESRATCRADVTQEDLTFSAGRLPAPCEIRRLVEVLDQAQYPLLIHCRRGVDRTGLASAIAKILFEEATIDEARGQLSPRYGHVSLGRTEAMLRFFDLYETWLAEQSLAHSPDAMRQFAACGYAAGPAPATLAVVSTGGLIHGRPGLITIRATNRGAEAWEMQPGTASGIHLRFRVVGPDDTTLQDGVTGLFRARIARGESVEIAVPINALPKPGRYTLFADMHETPDVSFTMLGGEPLELEFPVQ